MSFVRANKIQSDFECAICYKKINKTAFVCSNPCSKVFHPTCLEETFIQHDENAEDEETAAQQRCCYCRRHVNMDHYELELFGQQLRALRDSNGYDVHDALCLIQYNIKNNTSDDDHDVYDIYLPKNQTNEERKPKQSKKAAYQKNKKTHVVPRVAIRNNYSKRR
jgi:hypothetical protein